MRDQFLKWRLFILRSAVPNVCACCESCGHSLPLFSGPMMAESLNPWGSCKVPLDMCGYERVINNVAGSPLFPPVSILPLVCSVHRGMLVSECAWLSAVFWAEIREVCNSLSASCCLLLRFCFGYPPPLQSFRDTKWTQLLNSYQEKCSLLPCVYVNGMLVLSQWL